ncbi:putative membrane protein SirB2 [Cricetibacter osteomyelitidis]|uniref:Putative membrane protein SirB2 n=1 Tax=Cricetibacter osteomyelitidis TaxID=1521931 RepID=A0A4R2SWW2_9PAST|nr:SirB2 family protein [Cricetibacter osteomyelitidis]TCP94989.1 putative membrane protein SirB2 [Cricetibacter osteomyelitidis]
MLYLFYLHIICAFSSLALLLVRGTMQFSGKDWRAIKLLKILPHLVDTLLLVSGFWLFFAYGLLWETWILLKLAFLVLYVVFSTKFFSRKVQIANPLFFWLALLSFVGILVVAYCH